MMPIDDFNEMPEGRVDLQDAMHERPNAARRIGMGLKALYNFALMERMPALIADLLVRLEQAEQKAHRDRDEAAAESRRADAPPDDREP